MHGRCCFINMRATNVRQLQAWERVRSHSHINHTTRRHKIACNIMKTHKKSRLGSHMDHAAQRRTEPHFCSVILLHKITVLSARKI